MVVKKSSSKEKPLSPKKAARVSKADKFKPASGAAPKKLTTPKKRLDYIKSWKKSQVKKKQSAERKLNAFVNHMVKKYPKNYLEKIKEGLADDEKFESVVEEIEHHEESHSSETEKEFLERLRRSLKIED